MLVLAIGSGVVSVRCSCEWVGVEVGVEVEIEIEMSDSARHQKGGVDYQRAFLGKIQILRVRVVSLGSYLPT